MMKTNIIKMFNLPSYIRGKSFAEASKAIEKKFEGKTDKFSNDTKEVFMKRLSEAQEYSKQMENPQASMDQPMQNQQAMGGFDPTSMLIKKGSETLQGGLNAGIDAFGKTGIDTTGATGYQQQENINFGKHTSNFLKGDVTTGLQLLGDVIGTNKANKDINKANQNNAIKTSNMFDNSYALGGLVDPVEDKINSSRVKMNDPNRIPPSESNGLLDNTQGYSDNQWKQSKNDYLKESLSEWRKQKTGNTRNDNFSQTSPQYRDFIKSTETDFYKNNPRPRLKLEDYYGDNKMAKGGYTNDYRDGDLISILDQTGLKSKGITTLDPFGTYIPNKESYHGTTPGLEESALNAIKNLKSVPTNKPSQGLPKANLDPLKRAAIEAGRLAPAAFNAYQLANLDKPEYEQLNRLDNRYVKDNFDEQSLINNINSNYNKNYVKESSGGSLGSYAANSAAAELNKTRAISEGFQRGESINRQENTTAQQFNLGVDQQNLNQANLENENNVRNEGNYDTQKSRLLSQVGNDLGNIGKEQTFKQMVKDSGLCYDTSGAYICGTDTRLSDEQLKEIKSETNENAKGGMLDSNSMFTSYLEYLKKK